MELNNEELFHLYQDMLVFRAIEETMAPQTETWHGAAGEEASHVGAFFGLEKDDIVGPHFRGIYGVHYLRGLSLEDVFGEIYNRENSQSKGKYTGMVGTLKQGILPWCIGTLAQLFPLATGAALAVKQQKLKSVVVMSFGDSTSSRGEFHEALNFASIFGLPIVYVCINNQWGEYTPTRKAISARNIADRAQGYNMPGVIVDGNDVLAVHGAVQEAVARARRGEGPSLVECKTCRLGGHQSGDKALYRTREELEEAERWRQKDPIKQFTEYLIQKGVLTAGKAEEYSQLARAKAEKALQDTALGPRPRRDREFALSEVFAP
ncbi:MAG: thiamine pyrophosphate-dependent dehydrogenase E1 component subunit alpha [Dehalococcoidales bacterium]|nr:thiamine pyrophosphate-dependent dehydrogenase E1 component subunit alpha [Dehalococcoidales bacterium]